MVLAHTPHTGVSLGFWWMCGGTETRLTPGQEILSPPGGGFWWVCVWGGLCLPELPSNSLRAVGTSTYLSLTCSSCWPYPGQPAGIAGRSPAASTALLSALFLPELSRDNNFLS